MSSHWCGSWHLRKAALCMSGEGEAEMGVPRRKNRLPSIMTSGTAGAQDEGGW